MEGDIETRPLIFRDDPAEREVRLFAPAGHDYNQNELAKLDDDFTKLEANEPEIVRRSSVGIDREAGRLAVRLVVYGDHATIHARAPGWLAMLHSENENQQLGFGWSVGH